MSSATLQAAPLPPSTGPSLSPGLASTSRQYTSQPSPSRDPYYNQQNSNASPPSATSSTRRHGRRPSGNGATSNLDQHNYHSPSSGGAVSAPRSSRPSNTSGQTTSTAAVDSAPSMYPAAAPVEYQRGVPPVAPPRTSSNQRSGQALAAASAADHSRRIDQTLDGRQATSRQVASGDGSQERMDSGRGNASRQTNGIDRGTTNDDAAAAAAAAESRSRRRPQQSPQTSQPQRSSSNREARSNQPTAATGRPQAKSGAQGATPNGLSREGSEIINRVVISKPEVDLERERERERMAETHLPAATSTSKATAGLDSEELDATGRGGSRSRHDNAATSSRREKNLKFGEYFLGNTLGEGEFGKVKMGWKQEGGVQVAIKLIRKDSFGTNSTRLAKIYREIAILREISHPNIVRLHEMVETEKHIGIILEYASGGELFDYILNHRYLKDNAARKLFAQLVSGVGYLHKKGIVHRDLKLENLLLDRNRNIIITDFGFANTFNPNDELGEDIEYGLASREFVKRMELDKVLSTGLRRGDLMQTSCGSPCYAAPELVVSDSLYTGRKVDVWSCGVILYAMLAGYLPFDDDPANPEGDNINLLYKYIVSTPLTFPEYVTPHARDLLRRILVPDPRKRADLFEVARHSWLSEYADVVGFITSSTTTPGDIATTTVTTDSNADVPLLARSASVREPTKTQKSPVAALGDLGRKHGTVDQDSEESYAKTPKDNKRRTVQVEYVAPRSQTVRGEDAPVAVPSGSRTRAKSGSQGPVEVPPQVTRKAVSAEKPLPQDPPTAGQYRTTGQSRRPKSSGAGLAVPTRPGREPPRSVSDNAYMSTATGASIARPNTGGSMASTGSMGLTTRASYGQPVAPTVAGTNAHGHMSQPKNSKKYAVSNPVLQDEQDMEYGRPSISQVPSKFAKVAGFPDAASDAREARGHKRSSTVTGRIGSFFGGRSQQSQDKTQEKQKKYPPVSMQVPVGGEEKQKKYPPVSMPVPIGGDNQRQSFDSPRRSISFGFGRKRSGSIAGSGGGSSHEKSRRFSLLPASFSLKAIGIGKDNGNSGVPQDEQYYSEPRNDSEVYLEQSDHGGQGRYGTAEKGVAGMPSYQRPQDSPSATPPQSQRYPAQPQTYDGEMSGGNSQFATRNVQLQQQPTLPNQSDASLTYQNQTQVLPSTNRYPQGFNAYESGDARLAGSRGGRGVLQKNNRKFADAYEQEPIRHNAGSSGAARKVMDFFRRRGKAREGGER